jgi:hypothetical protein
MSGDPPAPLILTDEPYNVPIAGNVTGAPHREFPMASGEMSDAEFLAFNHYWMSAALPSLCEGGVFGTFIDWRGYPTIFAAASKLALSPLNLIVWAKTNAEMGSLYRSQHELLPLFRKGDAPHVNNVELGKKGRWRSNVWTYPGASSLGSDARRGLEDHPTVKPAIMLADAFLDLNQPQGNCHRPVPRVWLDPNCRRENWPKLSWHRARSPLYRRHPSPLSDRNRPIRDFGRDRRNVRPASREALGAGAAIHAAGLTRIPIPFCRSPTRKATAQSAKTKKDFIRLPPLGFTLHITSTTNPACGYHGNEHNSPSDLFCEGAQPW